MQNITVYDTEADRINKLCEELDTTAAELVQAFFDIIDGEDIDITDYL